jgi:hypothetical protein
MVIIGQLSYVGTSTPLPPVGALTRQRAQLVLPNGRRTH